MKNIKLCIIDEIMIYKVIKETRTSTSNSSEAYLLYFFYGNNFPCFRVGETGRKVLLFLFHIVKLTIRESSSRSDECNKIVIEVR